MMTADDYIISGKYTRQRKWKLIVLVDMQYNGNIIGDVGWRRQCNCICGMTKAATSETWKRHMTKEKTVTN